MFSDIKYFQQNHFQKKKQKKIFQKRFFDVWLVQKMSDSKKLSGLSTTSNGGLSNNGGLAVWEWKTQIQKIIYKIFQN